MQVDNELETPDCKVRHNEPNKKNHSAQTYFLVQ